VDDYREERAGRHLPRKKLPGEFNAWLDTLLRMEGDIAKDLKKFPVADGKARKETAETARRARILAADLLPRADAALKSLEDAEEALGILFAAVKTAPRLPILAVPVPAAGQPGVLSVVPGVHERIGALFGLSGIPEGERKTREDVPNGYYLNTEIFNSECFLVHLTPDGKEIKTAFKGAKSVPVPGSNRLAAIAGSLAYSRKRSVVGFFLDGKNNLQERSPQDVYSGGTVVNYSVADLRLAPDPEEAKRFHRARFGLDGTMSTEHLKARGFTILTKENLRISKRGPAAGEEFGTWVYGAVEGDFILNLSINRWSIRPDNWNPPAFDPDEAAWKICDIFFNR